MIGGPYLPLSPRHRRLGGSYPSPDGTPMVGVGETSGTQRAVVMPPRPQRLCRKYEAAGGGKMMGK